MINKEEFNNKIIQVASILGLTWEYQPEYSDNTGEIKGPDNICIWVRNGGYNEVGKIKIASVYPRDNKGQSYDYQRNISIRVSEAKSAEQIVKDIQRRFLPDYLANLQQVKESVAKWNDYDRNKVNNIKMIAQHFGWEVRNDSIYADIPEIYRIETTDDKEVKFEVRCSPEVAIKIIELLKKGV